MGARNHRRRGFCASFVLACGLVLGGCFWKDGGEQGVPRATVTAGPALATPGGTATVPRTALDADDAQELYREGRFAEARGAFEALAERSADGNARAEALVGAGNAAFSLNDVSSAFAAFNEAVKVAPEGSDVAVRARYLLVQRLNDAGRYDEAATVFNARPQLPGGSPLEPYYRFEGGRAQWANTGNAIWNALLAEGGVSGALKTKIRQSQVEEWRALGNSAELTSALDAVISDTGDAPARFERAGLAFEAGDTNTATVQLRALVTNFPGTRYATLALSTMADEGIEIDPGVAGLAYYRAGSYQHAIDVLEPGLAAADNASVLAFRAYYLAASYEERGDGAAAIQYYDLAANSGGSGPYIHRAKYWAARVSEWSEPAADVSARYVALVREGPGGEFTAESAFRAGYVLLEGGDASGALAAWGSLIEGSSARLEYWRARALLAAGDSQSAVAAYERASELGPLELYGIEAARQLGRSAPIDVRYRPRKLAQPVDWGYIESWLQGRIGGNPPGSAPTAACELAGVGLTSAAAAEIWGANAGADPWRRFELMREASSCGLTNVAAQLAVALRIDAGADSHEPPADLLRVSYPIDFGRLLDTESQKANIDPLFFASLIRQESLWDPTAGSSAGALGLAQIIPPTGEALANELGVDGFAPEMLFSPAVAIEFGAHYFGAQLQRYANPWIALAAYNAGPGNAARWAASGATSASDVVEAIDFSETRNYVTFIFEAYAHYRLAWGD